MTGRSENSNAQDEKGKATGADEVRLEMLEMAGDWGGSQVDRKATERGYAGGKENVEDRPANTDMEEERGCAWSRKVQAITLPSQVLKLLERVLDARIGRRVEGDFGEEQQVFRKVREIADGR